VQIEILAKKSGFKVEVIPDLQRDYGIKGMAFFNTTRKKFEIYLDCAHYQSDPDSYPFTIAEELSHIILHSKVFEQIFSIEERIKLAASTTLSNHQYIEKQEESRNYLASLVSKSPGERPD